MRGDFSNVLLSYLKKFRELHIEKRRFACIVMVLALMVAGSVVWRLKYTGIAMTNETFCGIEEHEHTEDCYEREIVCGMEEDEGHVHTDECYEEEQFLICDMEEGVPHEHTEECTELVLICEEEECEGHEHSDECYDEDGELICELEESEGHEHGDDCYEVIYICGFEEGEIHEHTDECYVTERVLICGEEERAGHVHQDECYRETLICGMEEHVHTIACLSDEAADVEDKSDWVATLPELDGIERRDVVAIAESQIGYTESTANFELDDDEVARGYTRYGAWYGNKYGKWDAMFVSFCLYYAKVSENDFPQAAGAYAWKAELASLGLYEDAADYVPLAGDVIFFDSDGDSRADRTGVVEYVDCEGEMLYIIEGDVETDDGDVVCENEYSLVDATIMGYGVLPFDEYVEEEEYTVEIEAVTETVTEAAAEEETEKVKETPTEAAEEEPGEPTEAAAEEATQEATETALTAALTANLTAKAYNKTFEGEDYIVMVSYGDDAGIPEGAELTVSEYDKNSEKYLARYAEAAALYGWEDSTEEGSEESTEESTDTEAGIATASEDGEEETGAANGIDFRLFNIEFVADGEVIEPGAEVKVTIIYLDCAEAAECSVTHFPEDAEAVAMDVETEYEDGVQMIAFDTDGFSDYGISLMSVSSSITDLVVQSISSVSELNGNSYAIISYTQNYGMLAELNTNSNGLKKAATSNALATFPQWTFELISGSGSSGTFYIYYEDDDGTKYYLQMTQSSSSEGNLLLTTSQSNASVFTVTVNSGTTVSIAATANGTTYYINQFSGDYGDADSVGFRGWYQNDTSLYLFLQSEELNEFRLWIYDENSKQVANYGDGSATGVIKYVDESNAVWCLIPVSYFESSLASAGYTFNSSATDVCPFQYAPDAYSPSGNLTDAYYFEYNDAWYVAVQDTTGEDPYRSNVYYTGTTDGAVIEDNIINDGTFVAKVYVDGVEMADYDGCTFTWYKSEDGETYTEVTDSSVLDGNTINVAEDNGGLCYYYFEVTLSDGTTTLKSAAVQVPYATELLNGSFESPDSDNQSGQYLEENVPYWNTTASDGYIEIGLYEADGLVYGATGTAIEGAGDQFAELNAKSSGALYQDVLTAPGEDLYWSLLHRARNAIGASSFVEEVGTTTDDPSTKSLGTTDPVTNTSSSWERDGKDYVQVTTKTTTTVETLQTTTVETTTYSATDEMYVVIMSASDAEKLLDGVSDDDQQDVLTAMIESILNGSDYGEGTYELVSGNSAGEEVTATIWKITTTSTVKEITTTVTTSEVTTVVTEKTKKNNTTTSTSTSTSVISTDTTTTYEYSSWESYSGEYVVPDGQYLTRFFFVSGETETGNTSVGNLLDEVYFSQEIQYTIEYWIWDNEKEEYYLVTSDTETGLVDPYTIVSAEKMAQYSENYALVDSVTGTQSGGSNPSSFDDPTTSSMKVQSGTTYLSLYFKNQGITIVKTLEGLSEDALDQIAAAGGVEFTFHVSGGTIDSYVTITVGDTGSGATYIYADSSVSGITYTITETGYATTLLNGAYTWVSVSPSESQQVTLTTDNAAGMVTFTNTYERVITLYKISTTSSATPLEGAQFVIYKVESGVTYYYTAAGGWSEDFSEAYVFETGSDGTVTVAGLDDGDYYLSEVKAPAGYNALGADIGFTLSGGTVTISDTTGMASVDGTEITVKNKPGEALPATGGRGTHLPIILGALMVLAALAVMFKNKRGEGEIV